MPRVQTALHEGKMVCPGCVKSLGLTLAIHELPKIATHCSHCGAQLRQVEVDGAIVIIQEPKPL